MRPGSQCARVLAVLADGQWHTVPSIHRRAGTMRLNSRVSELRAKGATIECDRNGRGKGAASYRYRLTAMSGPLVTSLPEPVLRAWTDEPDTTAAVDADTHAPRRPEERFRIYRLVADDLQLIATCPTAEAVGVALVTLGAEGEFERSCVGLLDALPDNGKQSGTWILNPWDADVRWT